MAQGSLSINGALWTFSKVVTLFALLGLGLWSSPSAVSADSLCDELISPLGYACNEYTVETADGFLLGVSNIPYGRAGAVATLGPPTLLLHGFQAGGDTFVSNSADESLGYVLADAGYDVYIVNNRNIQWSHGNSKYSYSDKEYWDWSWDELATYDLPAAVNFIYNKRSGIKVFFIGHSQGALTLFAALTDNVELANEVASKLRAVSLLVPFAFNKNLQAPLMKFLLNIYVDQLLPEVGLASINVTQLLDLICKNNPPALCSNLVQSFLGQSNYLNVTRLPLYLKYYPQVASSKNLNHYGQTKRSGLFQKYDRGPTENMIKYGQASPPLYDWSIFPTNFPLQIFTGGADGLATPIDVQRTLASIPSDVMKEVIDLPTYGHIDPVIGYRCYLDFYPQLLDFLRRH